jgi:sortase (surface protein transpeptidase)
MRPVLRRGGRVRGAGLGLLAVAVAGAVWGGPELSQSSSPVSHTRTEPAAPAAGASEMAADAASGPAAAFHSVRAYRAVAVPERIRIPVTGISSSLLRVGLAPDGTIAAPTVWNEAAWYDRGPRPGQQGPAVIVGHVDSRVGPAVFYRLSELRAGDEIFVDRADGSTARFLVTGVREFPKNAFPAYMVYAPTLQPSLVLITCGGTFNHATGHYRDNIIVTSVPG